MIWQNAVNYYFHEIDEWFLENGIHFERFVDDFCFVVDSKTFLLMLPELRSRLGRLGARLNEHKFYCQHYTKGTEWLGTHIKMDRIYVNKRIVDNGMRKARRLNQKVKVRNIEKLLSTMNSYLGVCKNTNGFNQAMKILNELSGEWKRYVRFNKSRVCLEALPQYSYRNRIVHQFNLS